MYVSTSREATQLPPSLKATGYVMMIVTMIYNTKTGQSRLSQRCRAEAIFDLRFSAGCVMSDEGLGLIREKSYGEGAQTLFFFAPSRFLLCEQRRQSLLQFRHRLQCIVRQA